MDSVLTQGGNSQCNKYKDEAAFFKTVTLICAITIMAQIFVIIIIFKMLRTQMAKLIQIHDFGLTEDYMKKQMLDQALDPTAEDGQ